MYVCVYIYIYIFNITIPLKKMKTESYNVLLHEKITELQNSNSNTTEVKSKVKKVNFS